jgi:phosphoribosylcarboxyaminoimidazole (NCAIR) mutase
VVLEPEAAALLAAKMLALHDPQLRERIAAVQRMGREKLVADDAALQPQVSNLQSPN